MPSLSQFANLFCANCMEVTLHRCETCITCNATIARAAPTPTSPRLYNGSTSEAQARRSRERSARASVNNGPRPSARARNEQRLATALNDPRVVKP